jgi:hypothetical protein
VREIVRNAAAHEYRWSSIILGIVESPTFLMQAPPVAQADSLRRRAESHPVAR